LELLVIEHKSGKPQGSKSPQLSPMLFHLLRLENLRMEPACLRHNELPHTSRLFTDFIYQYHKVERFYTAPPSTGFPEERRSLLIDALRQQNGDSPSLDLLSQPGTVTVVTGQQVGLFSGPAYTLYKALTAARHANDLTGRGSPAVPVFWLATEDHDFAEVNHSWVFDANHHPVQLKLDGLTPENEPVGNIVIDRWPVSELRKALNGFPFGGDVASLVEETHTPGATMGEAFGKLLRRLLEPFGFLFIDPMHPSTRQLAAPMLRKAVGMAPELNQLLLQRNRELEAAGYHAQVHVDARTSLFFVLENGKRLPVRDLRCSSDELACRPHELSPNALLRPVVQDFMLPTAAYVGGPAELAYFAQSQVLYERLLGHMPRLISRSGFTLFNEHSAKLMQRYRLRIQDFFHGEEFLREKVAARLVPPALHDEFDHVTAATSELLDGLHQKVDAFDPTLGASLQKSRDKILYQLSKSRAKAAREMLRRDSRGAEDTAYLYDGIFPHKHPQERFYSILPFLARHGVDLIDQLYANVRLECPDHILLPV
jgi:bacillithiol synthase